MNLNRTLLFIFLSMISEVAFCQYLSLNRHFADFHFYDRHCVVYGFLHGEQSIIGKDRISRGYFGKINLLDSRFFCNLVANSKKSTKIWSETPKITVFFGV